MRSPLEWSLLGGAVPATLGAIGGLGAGLLLYRTVRRRPRAVLAAGALALAFVAVGGWIVDDVWRPFPDRLPAAVLRRTAFGVAGVALVVVAWRGSAWRTRVLSVAAAVAMVLSSAAQVNDYYGQYPTFRAAMGVPPRNQISLGDVPLRAERLVAPPPGRPLSAVWRRPPSLPDGGRLLSIPIPGVRSGFAARPAWIYLPPAYLSGERARLPVLILIHGQPGGTRDWIDGGKLDQVLDRFARAHDGLAPIVVMPDALGTTMANPLCLDSRLGRLETYLSEDVPEWIREGLEVDPDHRHWAIGGYSYGGTCALQLGVRRPDRFATLLDISGQNEPTLGSRAGTVAAAFGGDERAFREANPLDIMARRRFPETTALIVVGRDDHAYRPQQREVRAACERAGMNVQYWELPGGHTWQVWGEGLVVALPALAARMGLTHG
ncbi:hypothetical protein Val02_04990 [Virgisporangium aliadipatigenens]|uniref:Esterase n=1 Tax=Virgisporangium aliadipatigenens TaxID=741659 RepID=A0A8J3YGK8_9ACTN|nr:alpha/beta hydrolase-fold protein [Virgisporangium aliadipatigenens]GIJ43613.1 hypothetical protein Val02_04990 [Virgisporangium aliadipatigenens]